MEILPKIIIVFGLIFDIAGVALLCYDVIYRPGNIWQINMHKERLKNELKARNSIIEVYRNLAQPPYTKEKIQLLIDDTNAEYEKERKIIAESMKNEEEDHPMLAQKLGLRGLLLVFLGFSLQIVGIILS